MNPAAVRRAPEEGHSCGHDLIELRTILLLATVALLPVATDLTIWAVDGGERDPHLRIGLSGYHFPLAALVAFTAWDVVRRGRTLRPSTGSVSVVQLTVGWFVVAFLFSPSWRGVDFLFHVAAAASIWHTTASGTWITRRMVLLTLAGVGLIEAILGIGQYVAAGPVGIDVLESGGRFSEVGTSVAIRGSLNHQYHYVGLILVSTAATFVALKHLRRSALRTSAVAALLPLGLAVPLTYSRAALLAVAPMWIILVLRHWTQLRAAILSWTVGLWSGAALAAEGMLERVERVSGGATSLDNGRIELIGEAIDVTRLHPLVGVGPGNYVTALRDFLGVAGDTSVRVLPAHNVVAHSAAEAGLLGGLLVLVSLIALVAWATRAGSLRWLAVASLLPFHLLDLFPYMRQIGLVVSGLWLGIAHIASAYPSGDQQTSTNVDHTTL